MPKSTYYHGDESRDLELRFDLSDLEPVTPYSDELKDEYAEAKSALEHLKHREEIIRRRAEELEEITTKEERFSEGQRALIEQIEGQLDLLDREAADAAHLAEQCLKAKKRFVHHLAVIQSLRPGSSDRNELRLELDHALRQINAAEEDVAESQPLIDRINRRSHQKPFLNDVEKNTTSPTDTKSAYPQNADFLYWLKAGLAFMLPLMTLIIALAFIMFFLK